MIVFLKLLLAHLTGDFLLQPAAWVKAKEEKKLRGYQLYVHALLHGLLAMLLVWDRYFWKWALLIAGVHLVIDTIKLYVWKQDAKRYVFFIDQLLHILSIYLVWLWYKGSFFSLETINEEKIFLWLTSIFVLTLPASIAVKILISKWSPHTEENDSESLQNAGKYIGILERLFVFAFIVTNHWEAVGFLIAAKSVFRFGDLKESKDRKLTEYILIGTLLSFGIAVLTGILCQYLNNEILTY